MKERMMEVAGEEFRLIEKIRDEGFLTCCMLKFCVANQKKV